MACGSEVVTEPDPLVGATLDGRYQIEALVGRGGMGSVYRARHLLMDQRVAVKVLRRDLASDATAARRFVREAKSSFRFDHPNCVRVSDLGVTPDGVPYLVMEYLDGRTVGDEIHYDGPFSPDRVAHIARQLCDALAHAHALSLIHRDLKPDNIMLLPRAGDADFTKVFDFGLAKLFDQPEGGGVSMFSMAALTQEGTIFGTPEYMSPEQATGQPLDPRSDIYAVGVIMYEMLTGSLPLKGTSYMGTLSAHVKEVPIPPCTRRPDLGIPPALDALVMKCLAKRATLRPQTAAEVAEVLARLHAELLQGGRRSASAVATSATVDLSSEASEATHAARAQAVTQAVGASQTDEWLRGVSRGRRRRWGIALATCALLIGGVAVAVTMRGDDSSPRETAAGRALDVDASYVVGPAPRPPRSDRSAVAMTHDAGAPPRPVRAAPPDGGQRTPAASVVRARASTRSTLKRSAARQRVATHLAAAGAARRAGNTLKQIAEAHEALGLDRRSTRAAYLLGDALIRSGDKDNGCKYLRRARRSSSARTRARQAGCRR